MDTRDIGFPIGNIQVTLLGVERTIQDIEVLEERDLFRFIIKGEVILSAKWNTPEWINLRRQLKTIMPLIPTNDEIE